MPLILGTNSIKETGFNVANSLRFNRGSSDSLERTPSSASNRKTFTFSGWFKLANLASSQSDYYQIFGGTVGGGNEGVFISDADDIYIFLGGEFHTDRKFRDPNAWYHVVFAVDTTQSTDTNRVKLYINGVQETSFSSTGYPNQNHDTAVNNTTKQNIGERQNDDYFDGYMAEVVLIDGQQLTPTSFGEFDEDSGIWKPIDVSGLTFGTNGFYLDFEDSSALGNDVSGNNNNFTVNNLTAIDQSTDTCTNNGSVWNSIAGTQIPTLSEGNLKAVRSSGSWTTAYTTIAAARGKWYCEIKWVSGSEVTVGFLNNKAYQTDYDLNDLVADPGGDGYAVAVYKNGALYENGSNTGTGYGTYASGNTIMLAMDLDNYKLYTGQGGTWGNSANPASGTGGISIPSAQQGDFFHFAVSCHSSGTSTISANFGSPAYSESGGETDGDGYGNFANSVPSGYFCLNSKNLAEYG
jgi:hypothetical protein